MDVPSIDQNTFDLSVKNPSKGGEVALRETKEISKSMKKLDAESKKILEEISHSL